MKNVLALLVVLILSGALWAQTEIPQGCECEQTVTVFDPSCTTCDCSAANCACEHVSFTASCSGCYKLSASVMACTSGNCTDYTACVFVYEGSTSIAHVHNSPCNSTCDGGCYVCLIAGHTYGLYACLTQCQVSCPSPATCQAKGMLIYCGANTVCTTCNNGC